MRYFLLFVLTFLLSCSNKQEKKTNYVAVPLKPIRLENNDVQLVSKMLVENLEKILPNSSDKNKITFITIVTTDKTERDYHLIKLRKELISLLIKKDRFKVNELDDEKIEMLIEELEHQKVHASQKSMNTEKDVKTNYYYLNQELSYFVNKDKTTYNYVVKLKDINYKYIKKFISISIVKNKSKDKSRYKIKFEYLKNKNLK